LSPGYPERSANKIMTNPNDSSIDDPMSTAQTKQLLARWKALDSGDGLQRAAALSRALWVVGLALFTFVVFGVVYRLHPAAIAAGAAIMGWVTAERNALRTRATQWPIFKQYIDWNRVHQDLNNGVNAT
jgi:hypothetical protein